MGLPNSSKKEKFFSPSAGGDGETADLFNNE
jgi:hypothetical protein